MKNTRLMEILFSNQDEEVANQVDNDIRTAEEEGVVDTDELTYENTGDGVAITDKGTGEVTLAQRSNEANTYDLIAVPDEHLERYLHPSANGYTLGNQVSGYVENVRNHMTPELLESMGLYPEDQYDYTVEENAEGDQKNFSVYSDNGAFQRIFSHTQETMEHIFSEVIDSEETVTIGDLKVEKSANEENAVIVTSLETGDQVKVTLSQDEMEVQELDSKNFSDSYLPYYIIGVEPYDHILVEAQAYTNESVDDLLRRLAEEGVEACKAFKDPQEAREYAFHLLDGLGANPDEGKVDEPQIQRQFSDCTIYSSNYWTGDTVFMSRMFSEQELGITNTRSAVEQSLSEGEEIEVDGATITPIEATKAIIEDNGQYTLATIQGEDTVVESLDPEEAEDYLNNGEINSLYYDDGEDEREYSDVYSDEYETRFFSVYEDLTDYMERIFSEESDQNIIEESIETQKEIENNTEIVTPVSDDTAVIKDKIDGDYTKAVILDEDRINLHPISHREAELLLEDVEVNDDEDDEEVEHEFSDVYSDEYGTRFFSAIEPINSYMLRLFTEEADQEHIEEALDDQQQVETDDEIITPVSENTVVIEDKKTGDYSKAVVRDEDDEDNDDEISHIEVNPIDEDEAEDLLEDVEVSKEKQYSSLLYKFFAEEIDPQQQNQGQEGQGQLPADPAQGEGPIEQQGQPIEEEQGLSVENIEDKAELAVQSIRAAAEQAAQMIMEAKAAPVPTEDPEIQEAQFSERTFCLSDGDDTLISWLRSK